MRRFVAILAARSKTRFAAVLPNDGFGQAMAAALGETLAEAGLPPASLHFHTGSTASVNQVMREVSAYAARRGPLDAQLRAATALHTAEGRKRAAELRREQIPPPPMDALVLADFGDMLGTLASLLPYYDLDTSKVRVLGPAQWASPQVAGAPELRGAWYAAPDPALRRGFVARYAEVNGTTAPGLADFAYDAASIARALVQSGEGYSMAALCRAEGFAGVNGVLGLLPDGRVRRGLAVFEVNRGGAAMIEAAPNTLGEPGI
jgi:ABC-type branched-subunit amino acid transport system substrate-binding protein